MTESCEVEAEGKPKSAFTKSLGFSKLDPKFKKFGEGKLPVDDKRKKVRISDSFLAAKATYSKQMPHQNLMDNQNNPVNLHEIVYPDDISSDVLAADAAQSNKKLSIRSKETEDMIIDHFSEHGLQHNSQKTRIPTSLEPISHSSATSVASSFDGEDIGSMGENGRFICKTEGCMKSFGTRKELRRHKLCHRVRKHVCPLEGCGRAFFEKSKLKRHMVVHTKKKEHSCPLCGKKFGYKANVKTHMRTHTGERPFMCRLKGCGKTFAQASNRNAHEKTHDNKTNGQPRFLVRSKNSVGSFSDDSENDTANVSSRKRKASLISLDDSHKELDVSFRAKASPPKSNTIDYSKANRARETSTEHESNSNVRRSHRIQSRNGEDLNGDDMKREPEAEPIQQHRGQHMNEAKANVGSLPDFDDVMNDIYKLSHIELQSSSNIMPEISPLGNLNLLDDAGSGNILFNSFTSFGYSAGNESDLHSMFKTDFGLNLDTLTEQDVFSNQLHNQQANHEFSLFGGNNTPTNSSLDALVENKSDLHFQSGTSMEAKESPTSPFSLGDEYREPDSTKSSLTSNR